MITAVQTESATLLPPPNLRASPDARRRDRPYRPLGRSSIIPCAGSGPWPLSYAQQRLWFIDQLGSTGPLYNMPLALRLRGQLDCDALRKTLATIVARHQVLRVNFTAVDGEPRQELRAGLPVELAVLDWRALPAAELESRLHVTLKAEFRRPFDLNRDPLLRATLLRLGDAEHVLTLVMHHIVSDAWSWGVFFRELAAGYEAFAAGRAPVLPDLPIQYVDFAVWQRQWLAGENLQRQLMYWKQQLADAPWLLELPTDRPRPAAETFCGARQAVRLPATLVQALKALGQQNGATLSMTWLAIFKTLLHRYTRQTDLVVGCPVAGRNHIATEPLIGFFVNTLCLRTSLAGNPPFLELLARVRQTTLAGISHQDLPFEQLVSELQPARGLGCSPLIQVMFACQNTPAIGFSLPGLEADVIEMDTATAKFDLTLFVEESAKELILSVEYRTDLFEAATMTRMLGHLRCLAESVTANPARPLAALPLLTPAERQQLLGEWNAAPASYPRDKTIPQLFEEQAERTPQAVAVIFQNRQLTYQALNERANQLAQYLHRLGVGRDNCVAVCMERSLDLMIALLGILKAGGAYVGLETNNPIERLACMLKVTRARVLLTQEKLKPLAGAAVDMAVQMSQPQFAEDAPVVLALDALWPALANEARTNPTQNITAESLAYISFTSGSTGQPKGVCIPHRGVVRLVKGSAYASFNDEVFLQLAPISFDASTLEIWGPWLNGGRLVVFPPGIPTLTELGEFIVHQGITTLWLTAGLFHQMVEEKLPHLKGLRQLLAGGDVLFLAQVQRAVEQLPHCRLINGYGPTENTTFTCCYAIPKSLAGCRSVPIGRPIANTEVYVLDEELQPVPVGIPGHLFAGGDGLARGYLDCPELTHEKFIPHPFRQQAGARLYRTGDLVRWLPDGNLEFLGRADQQVKIRGFRVELGEIEALLAQHPAVRECVVVARPDSSGDKRLIACLVAAAPPPPDDDSLRRFLAAKLPAYMVPGAFVWLPVLPLNRNGKVDRQALPGLGVASGEKAHFLAPRDPLETNLARIWEQILGLQPVGIRDNFFELGGHSLLAVRLTAQIEKKFAKKIPVGAIFQAPTVEQQAKILSQGVGGRYGSSLVAIQPNGSQPPLCLVHGAGGGMFWGYANLARYLGGDQPVYGFQSRGMDGLPELESIAALAAQYVADLRTLQPHGPYYLGGYCFGGNVAYEMARLLTAQGERVALLFLMNCAPPNCDYARFRWSPVSLWRCLVNLNYWLGYLLRLPIADCWAALRWKLRTTLKHGFTRRADAPFVVDDIVHLPNEPEHRRRLWAVHVRALLDLQPQPYSGHVSLFRTRTHSLICSFDPQCGWGEFAAGGVTVKIVPGAHETILEEPNVQKVARELQTCLANSRATQASPMP